MDGLRENKIKTVELLFRIVAIVLIVALVVCGVSRITERKDSARKYGDFIEHADEVDVLFLGSSHMMNAVDPVQLYNDTGITAYNFGKPGGMLPESYWTLKLARQYANPKCVVIDLWSLDRDYKYVDIMDGDAETARSAMSFLHTNLDAWPLTTTKVDAVFDLLSTFDARIEYLFKFSFYHSRWNSLNKDDFIMDNEKSEDETYLLGAEARREIFINHNLYEPEDKSGMLDEGTLSIVYLKKMIEECQADNIDVVLTFMPMGGSYFQDFQAVNYGHAIAEEYGIEFIDMLDQQSQTIIDYESDMSDDSHVNEFGMSKITAHIGNILSGYTSLKDHRQDQGYEMYERAVAIWQQRRVDNLLGQEDLYMTLGYLNMMNANFVMYLRGDSKALSDGYFRNQIKKISGTERIEEAKDLSGPYILLRETDPNTGQAYLYERASDCQESDIPVIQGTAEYIGMKEFGALYYNGDYDSNLFDMNENYHKDLQLFILGADGAVLANKNFEVDWK